jgi:hypothetical protein
MEAVLRAAAVFAVSGSLLAAGLPAFWKNLSASRVTESLDGLARISSSALASAAAHRQEESFPPSVELTPRDVPRGEYVIDPPGTWAHLTWRALNFECDGAHAYSFRFESSLEPTTGVARFMAAAHGDLDGDGVLSTLQVQGERLPGRVPRLNSGILVKDEFE